MSYKLEYDSGKINQEARLVSDEAGKTRRNLMAFSTGVIGVGALGIPLTGSTFLGLNLQNVDPLRVWACSLVVLIYLTLRHWYDPNFQEVWSTWKKYYAHIKDRRIGKLVYDAYDRRQDGKLTLCVSFRLPDAPTPTAKPGRYTQLDLTSPRTGVFRIQWRDYADEKSGLSHDTIYPKVELASFSINPLVFGWIHLRTAREATRLSWRILEMAVPMGLAAVAISYSGWRLVCEYIQ